MAIRLGVVLLLCALGIASWLLVGPEPASPAEGRRAERPPSEEGRGVGTIVPEPAVEGEVRLPAVAADLEVESGEPETSAPDRIRITVRVVDERGRGFEGADVVAETVDPDEPRPLPSADRKGSTDAEGRVELRLFSGWFRIGANRRGTCPDHTSESVEVELFEDSPPVHLALRPRSAAVRVKLVHANGLPLAGARIELAEVTASELGAHQGASRPEQRSERTGDDGVAWFRRVAPGVHWISIPRAQDVLDGLAIPRVETFDVEPNSAKELLLVLAPTASIRYRLSEVLPPGVTGSLSFRSLAVPPSARGTVLVVEGDGAGTVELAPGRWEALCSFQAHDEYVGDPIEFDVEAGSVTERIVPIRRQAGVLSGVTVHPDGRLAPRAWIQVLSVDRRTLLRLGRSDDQGRFLVRGLPDGPVDVHGAHELGLIDHDEPSLRLDAATRDVTVVLPPSWTILGSVFAPPSGAAPPGRPVHLFEAERDGGVGQGLSTRTTEDGSYRFDGLVPGGSYWVVAGDAFDGDTSRWRRVDLGPLVAGGDVLHVNVEERVEEESEN